MPLCPFCRSETPFGARFCPHCTQDRFDYVPPQIAGPDHDFVGCLGMCVVIAVGYWFGFAIWQLVVLAVVGAVASSKLSKAIFGD